MERNIKRMENCSPSGAVAKTIFSLGFYGAFFHKNLVSNLNEMTANTFGEDNTEKIKYSHKFVLIGLLLYYILTPLCQLLFFATGNNMFFTFMFAGVLVLFITVLYYLRTHNLIKKRINELAIEYDRPDIIDMQKKKGGGWLIWGNIYITLILFALVIYYFILIYPFVREYRMLKSYNELVREYNKSL